MRRLVPTLSLTPILFAVALWLLTSSAGGAATVRAADMNETAPEAADASILFVDASNTPLANTDLWIFCYGDERGQILASQRWFRTDSAGQIALPDSCAYLVALNQKHTQPSGKAAHGPAYWVFDASWQMTAEGLLPTAAAEGAEGGAIVVERPFVLFNIVASIEWDLPPSAETITRLYNGLEQSALYLADMTEGYMSFGPVTILQGGRRWEGADLRLQAANDLRPAAFVGGIVPEARAVNTGIVEPTFEPAAIFLGRKWNGRDAASGEWDEDAGWRTVGHEWAHYALFLFDEYQNSVGEPIFCTQIDLPTRFGDPGAASVMAYHYNASELWHPDDSQTPANTCQNSDQFRVHGEEDWRTLEDWYAMQGLAGRPELTPLTRPLTLPAAKPEDATAFGPLADLYGRSPVRAIAWIPYLRIPGIIPTPPLASNQTLSVIITDALTQSFTSQVYLLDGDAAEPATIQRILHQGNIRAPISPTIELSPTAGILGTIDLLGVTPGDQARVYVDRYASMVRPGLPPGRFTYQIDESVPATATVEQDEWQSTLDFVYTVELDGVGTGRLTTVDVLLYSYNKLAELEASPPIATLCVPNREIGCNGDGWQQTLVNTAPGTYKATFVAPIDGELPLYGVVRVQAPGAGELVRWFRDLGGVGPGHMFGGASLREGVATVDTVGENVQPGECNRVMVMPATNYDMLTFALPDNVTLVSLPVDIDILLAGDNEACQGEPLTNKEIPPTLVPLRLTLVYNEDMLTSLGLSESTLQVLHFAPLNQEWQLISEPKDSDTSLNWASALIYEDGIYAVVARLPEP